MARHFSRPVRRDRHGLTRCRVCGCTDVDPCADGCSWMNKYSDLCTTCAVAAEAVVDWFLSARRPNQAALWREVDEQLGFRRCYRRNEPVQPKPNRPARKDSARAKP